MTGIWVAQLERFGFNLLVAERSKEKALKAISDEYKRAYLEQNKDYGDLNCDTIEEMEQDEEFREFYDMAMEEVYCVKIEYGKVQWW